ncbi:gamma-glutamyltransferase [Jatrophihabitans telluris]|uniref:Gamma-glutamyltransferase n=1 Tax=Jatrophihabitans telluris TaxID=2038343 RepID=A0ABY4QXL1_9ACTN|nr:gamma-glutamyltransferase [Jatrophihabitans telluris]UQX88339.1 gamma-glutamyltransferase [Jatrophihabitans telluris]
MTTRPELIGSFGMVASTHWLASAAGMSVLERGGNAFDAAVAAGFTLQIVEPHLNGPGGDMPAVVHSVADARPWVICGQGVAPRAATIDRFTDLGLSLVPGSGPLAATVPGAFGAWTTMLERWGSWELSDVLAPALHYAEAGFPLLATTRHTIESVRTLFLDHWPTSAATWLDAGTTPKGRTWRSPGTAATYRRVLREAVGSTREARIGAARRAWYDGFVAEAIDAFGRKAFRDTSGRNHAGLLTADDLAAWHAGVEDPVSVDYAGRFEVFKTAAWGQGPVLLQQLRLVEAAGIHDLQAGSADWVHLVTEASKLAFADREAWYGDSPDVPVQALLSGQYAAERAALIGDVASHQLRPGRVEGRNPVLAELPEASGGAPGVGEPTLGQLPGAGPSSGDTCHVDVVDRWGNLVSATPSGGWLQSAPVIAELGFCLGTRAQMFFLQPGLPNSLRPGVRPRTTLTPSLAYRDGSPWLAFGTPGGDQQDQWQLVFFARVAAAEAAAEAPGTGGARVDLQQIIDEPMFHHNHAPSSFYPRDAHPAELIAEDRLGDDVLNELARRGHDVVRVGDWRLGRLSAAAYERGPDGIELRAAANPRGSQGYAAGR